MTWLGRLILIVIIFVLGTCLIGRRFPSDTANIERVRKSKEAKIQKQEPKLPVIPKKKNLKLKPWKREQIFYTLEEEELFLLC